MIVHSKKEWESLLKETLGDSYEMLCAHGLQVGAGSAYWFTLEFLTSIQRVCDTLSDTLEQVKAIYNDRIASVFCVSVADDVGH